MNSALIVHLLTLVEHHVHGRHFTPFIVPECFQWVTVHVKAGIPKADHRLICGVIRVAQRSASVSWGW